MPPWIPCARTSSPETWIPRAPRPSCVCHWTSRASCVRWVSPKPPPVCGQSYCQGWRAGSRSTARGGSFWEPRPARPQTKVAAQLPAWPTPWNATPWTRQPGQPSGSCAPRPGSPRPPSTAGATIAGRSRSSPGHLPSLRRMRSWHHSASAPSSCWSTRPSLRIVWGSPAGRLGQPRTVLLVQPARCRFSKPSGAGV